MKSECPECYSAEARITPLLHPMECLQNHTQYICGTCGRCICIEHDDKRGLQRWNFPFQSMDIAKLYLRTADETCKKPCGIYEITNEKGRKSYKILSGDEELRIYLTKNKDKVCEQMSPVYIREQYLSFHQTQIRKLTPDEILRYMSQRER